MDALVINLRNSIVKLTDTIATPLSLITAARMSKVDDTNTKVNTNLDAKVSSRATQESVDAINTRLTSVESSMTTTTTQFDFEVINSGFNSGSPKTFSIAGRGRILRIDHTGSGSTTPIDRMTVDNNVIFDGNISAFDEPLDLNIKFTQSFEYYVWNHGNVTIYYVLED